MDGWRQLLEPSEGESPRLLGRPFLCISDIHGDLAALESVLAAVRHVDLAGIIACGNHVVGGAQPFDVWTRLVSLGAHMTCGPTDMAVSALDRLEGMTPRTPDEERRLAAFWATRQALGDVVCRRLSELPTTVVVSLDDTRGVMALHGSPADDDDVLEDDDDLEHNVATVAEDVLVTGAGVPFARRVVQPSLAPIVDEDGEPLVAYPADRSLLVVNVGTVGLSPGRVPERRRSARTAHAVLVGSGDDGGVHAWGTDVVVGRARLSRRAG